MRRHTSPSTIAQEEGRQASQETFKSASRELRRELGEIVEVFKGRALAKIRLNDGTNAAGGVWIRILTPPKDIVLRYGNLRPGLKVALYYSGNVEKDAYAEIIGDEEDGVPGTQLLLDNNIQKALYEVFVPGSLLG